MVIRLASAALTLVLLAIGSPSEDGTVTAPAAARPSPAFRFETLDNHGRAVRWDPCEGIRLLFNPAHAPAGTRRELKKAVRVIGRASGLSLRVVGETATRPSAGYGDEETGDQWPDVLVAFVTPHTHLLSDDGDSGETTTTWITEPSGLDRYVTGEVLINAGQNNIYGDGTDGRASRVRLFEHELGHLVGLDHVQDRRSLMYPWILRRKGLTAGDRSGLRQLGPAGDTDARCPD